jgi:aminocarboxymuconate-semialdehyde decarboxylase
VPVIDAHSHFLAPPLLELLRAGDYAHARVEERGDQTWIVCTSGLQFPLTPLFHDPAAKLQWMDERGIDLALTSTCAPLFLYELPTPQLDEVCRQVNDAAAELANASGGRIIGMATVPLTDPELAANELRRAHDDLGLNGVEIGTSIGETMLDHPSLDTFYTSAEEVGATVLLHPYIYMLGLRTIPGFERFFLQNNIGNMVETHIAAARLLLGGVFDRHPNLRIQLSHGGGGLTYQLARLDHTYRLREQVREVAQRPPSEYLGNLLFDTVIYDAKPLRFLLDLAGPENVVFGTDHPFDIADTTAIGALRKMNGETASMVLERNAARAYALD